VRDRGPLPLEHPCTPPELRGQADGGQELPRRRTPVPSFSSRGSPEVILCTGPPMDHGFRRRAPGFTSNLHLNVHFGPSIPDAGAPRRWRHIVRDPFFLNTARARRVLRPGTFGQRSPPELHGASIAIHGNRVVEPAGIDREFQIPDRQSFHLPALRIRGKSCPIENIRTKGRDANPFSG